MTPLGFHLASLPVDIHIGKMIIYGAIFHALDAVLTIAATLSHKSPFSGPFDKKGEVDTAKRSFSDNSRSDHITYLNAYRFSKFKIQLIFTSAWLAAYRVNESKRFCKRNYLSESSLLTIRDMKMFSLL